VTEPTALERNLVNEIFRAVKKTLAGFGNMEARDFGLYTGLEHKSADSQFWERVHTETEQKKALAEYLTRRDLDDGAFSLCWPGRVEHAEAPKQVFFESGSTICPLIGSYAQILDDTSPDARELQPPETVLTNNMYALTALVNLVKRVVPVQGSFLTKYFGFFPFGEDVPPEKPPNECVRLWREEGIAYTRLKNGIGDSDLVYATCSNFSFLAGPLIGGRANAITKNAMYVGKNKEQRFVLLFHFEKIIPITKAPAEMSQPKDRCRCALARPKNLKGMLAKKKVSQWHGRWAAGELHNEADDFSSGLESFSPPGGAGPLSIADFAKPWLELAEGVHIVISLPSTEKLNYEKAFKWLSEEVQRAEELAQLWQPLRYKLPDEDAVYATGVVDIEVCYE
jgi:hypothetical protein